MGDFNFACGKCPRTFKLEEFYEKHKRVHDLKKQHTCHICGFVYGAAKGLEGHLKTHEETKEMSPIDILTQQAQVAQLIQQQQQPLPIPPPPPPLPPPPPPPPPPSQQQQQQIVQGDRKIPSPAGTGKYDIYDSVPEVTDASAAMQNDSGFFMCSICSREFSGLNSLKKHVPIHTRRIQHKCDVCGYVFGKKEYLMDHMRKHTGENSPVCEICGQTFNKSLKLKEHFKLHRNVAIDGSTNESVPFRCHVCQDVYMDADGLKRHLATSHDSETPLYRCDICQATFGDVRGKNHHMYNEHQLDAFHQKCVWCPVCSQGFTRHYNLKVHMYKSHGKEYVENNFTPAELAALSKVASSPTKSKQPKHYFDKTKGTQMLSCQMCSDKFLRKMDLYIHLEATHSMVLPVCTVCEEKFTDLSDLKDHLTTVHSIVEKKRRRPGPASKTNAPMANRANINNNNNIEHFTCELCHKSFPCQENLEAHQRAKHPNLNKRLQNLRDALGLELQPEAKKIKLECNGNIDLSLSSSSSPSKTTTSGRNTACPICGVVLSPKTNINVHMRTHSGDRPYQCVLCLNKFRQKAHLMKHFRCSHNQKKPPYVCEFCGSSEAQSSNDLYRHIADSHKTETDLLHAKNGILAKQEIIEEEEEEDEEDECGEEDEEEEEEEEMEEGTEEEEMVQEEEEEEDIRYEPITEEFYFENMVIVPCYVVIPYVTDSEVEAACSVTQDVYDDLEEDQGRLTIDESVVDDEAANSPDPYVLDSLAKKDKTPFSGEQYKTSENDGYNADDIKVETPSMGFYPNISDFSLPFSLSGLWKKKADILGPTAMKQADLLEKQIKKINEFEKRQAEARQAEDEDDDAEEEDEKEHPMLPTLPITPKMPSKIMEVKSSPGKGHKNKTSPHKTPDAAVSQYEAQIQNEIWPLDCIKCNAILGNLDNFNLHMNDHWTGDKCCPVCGLLINSKRFNFKQHLKIHTGEKPFVCQICQRSFRQKAHMVKHVTTHRSIPNAAAAQAAALAVK